MLKYAEELVTFTEVPDEVSLCFNISNCPCHCPYCFEPWLAGDIGEELTIEVVKEQLKKHNVSCICFMGGDGDYVSLIQLCREIRALFPDLKLAMYSGRDKMNMELAKLLDYYKIGPFIKAQGPLNFKTTNQIFYKKQDKQWINITYKFWDKKE